MINKVNIAFLGFLASIIMISCSTSGDDTANKSTNYNSEEITKHNAEEAKKIFYMLPSPIETASLIRKSGAEYDGSILNPVENAAKHETTTSKALNLGVYAADLSVASVFDQTQEGMLYVVNCKKMCDDLGISEAFDAGTIERIEANLNDKDSLMYLVSNAYYETDAYLKENELSNLSALIISGGWIEGLHVAIQLQKSSKSNLLKKRIAEQKYSLSHLLEILSTYKEEARMKVIYDDLLDLYSTFSKIKSVKTEPNQEKNVIGASHELELTDDVLLELENKTSKIRNSYINI